MSQAPPRESDHPNVEHDDGFERSFRKRHPALWLSTLLGPFILTGLLLTALALTAGAEYVQGLLAAAAATFFFFGRFVILGGVQFFSAEQLVLMVLYMDLMTAMLPGLSYWFSVPVAVGRQKTSRIGG